MKAAILYAAKSTADVHGSIPTQLADSRAMAEREDYDVIAEYSEDGKSGYRGNRGPRLAEAIEHAERLATEAVDVAIFMQHSDRLARGDGVNQKQVIQYVWEAQRDGYSFRSVQDDMTFTEQSGLMAFVMGLRNHEDSKRKGAATSAGLRRMAERGRHHGPAPYGYRWIGTGTELRLVIDEIEACVVRRIFQEFVETGVGLARLARRLDEGGIRPPRGKRWGQHTLANILDQPVYMGQVRFKGETFAGNHPPIIEQALWLRAQALRQERKPGTAGGGHVP
jgi:DNA invertase Pin-like site-specific DNA recombinase